VYASSSRKKADKPLVVAILLLKMLVATYEENSGKLRLRVHPHGTQEQLENHCEGPEVDWKSALACASGRRRRETLAEGNSTAHKGKQELGVQQITQARFYHHPRNSELLPAKHRFDPSWKPPREYQQC
jgi:hypothetical protein